MKPDLLHQMFAVVAEVSGGCDREHVLSTESSDADFCGLISVVGPVLAVKTNDDDVVGQVVGYGGDVGDASASYTVLPDFEVADFVEAGLKSYDRRISIVESWNCGVRDGVSGGGGRKSDRNRRALGVV
jgi:hypothetical protein